MDQTGVFYCVLLYPWIFDKIILYRKNDLTSIYTIIKLNFNYVLWEGICKNWSLGRFLYSYYIWIIWHPFLNKWPLFLKDCNTFWSYWAHIKKKKWTIEAILRNNCCPCGICHNGNDISEIIVKNLETNFIRI